MTRIPTNDLAVLVSLFAAISLVLPAAAQSPSAAAPPPLGAPAAKPAPGVGAPAGAAPVPDAVPGQPVGLTRPRPERIDPNAPLDMTTERGLSSAIQRGDVDAVTAALDKDPTRIKIDPADKTVRGDSPLWYAVDSRVGNDDSHLAMVTLLLNRGADPNFSGRNLVATLVTQAIDTGRIAVLKLLLQKGADPNAADRMGATPLEHALGYNAPGYFRRGGGLTGSNRDAVAALLDANVDLKRWDNRGLTPLQAAASMPGMDPAIVDLLLQKGAELDAPTRSGTDQIGSERSEPGIHVLHLAAGAGNVALVQLLLKDGAKVNQRTDMGETPLHFAARTGPAAVVPLLAAGADANAGNGRGDTPLMLALGAESVSIDAERTPTPEKTALLQALIPKTDLARLGQNGLSPLLMALEAHDKEARELLIAADTHASPIEQVFDAAAQNDTDRLKKLLADAPYWATTVLPDGWTPLHVAARWNAADSVTLLLSQGADVNARDSRFATPLYRALMGAQSTAPMRATAAALLAKGAAVDAGADTSRPSQFGRTFENDNGERPLDRAIGFGDADLVAMFLKKGARVTLRNSRGDTPLMLAVNRGNAAIVAQLLDAGSDVNSVDSVSYTPLMRAIMNGSEEVAELLVARGADVNAGPHDSPLVWAVRRGNLQMTKLLLANKARIDATSPRGESLLMLARNYPDIQALLKQNGAQG